MPGHEWLGVRKGFGRTVVVRLNFPGWSFTPCGEISMSRTSSILGTKGSSQLALLVVLFEGAPWEDDMVGMVGFELGVWSTIRGVDDREL